MCLEGRNPNLQPHLGLLPKSIHVWKVFQQAMHLTEDGAAFSIQLHLLLTVNLGKLLSLSEPQLLHLYKETNHLSSYR